MITNVTKLVAHLWIEFQNFEVADAVNQSFVDCCHREPSKKSIRSSFNTNKEMSKGEMRNYYALLSSF